MNEVRVGAMTIRKAKCKACKGTGEARQGHGPCLECFGEGRRNRWTRDAALTLGLDGEE